MKHFKGLLLLSALFIKVSIGHTQVVGKPFPELTGETATDQVITLPTDMQDKFTLVGMAYSKRSETDLVTWFSPVYHKFINESTDGLFASFSYDINVFFVPMFTGINTALKGVARQKAVAKLDDRLLPHILFYKGRLKPYKEALDFARKDVPYLFVIDQSGNIVYATSGKYTEEKIYAIEEVLDQ